MNFKERAARLGLKFKATKDGICIWIQAKCGDSRPVEKANYFNLDDIENVVLIIKKYTELKSEDEYARDWYSKLTNDEFTLFKQCMPTHELGIVDMICDFKVYVVEDGICNEVEIG